MKAFYRRISVWDRLVVRRWQRVSLSMSIDRLLKLCMRVGDGWGWVAIASVLYLAQPWPFFRILIGQALLAVAISLPVYWALKLGFRRVRPFAVRGTQPRVPPLDKFSFPSGHTMNNLAVAMTLALHIPLLWPLAVIPVALGLLRVLYGVHFVSDIAAGAVLGAFSSLGAHWLFQRLIS